jgi:cell division transport system ATP-binding protein
MSFRADGSESDSPVRLYHVSKSYSAGSFALRDVSLDVGKGEFVFLTGASGAGKTTLLELIFAAEKPTEGQIVVLGRNIQRIGASAIPALRRKVGVVFQDFKLLARRTVEENVRMTLDVIGAPRREARAKVFRLLKQVGLQHRRYHHPLSLSGGEQQRVAIARALVNEPRVVLADEPTGNLDEATGEEILSLFEELHEEGRTLVVVTHSDDVAERAGRVIRLRDGRVTGPSA